LLELDGGAVPLAGGQSLIPLMNLGLVRPHNVVDLNNITQLRGIESTSNDIVIRAMVTQREAETSDIVRSELPLLAHALSLVGFRPTRTRGTVVGSLTHADPAGELPMVALALDARIRLVSQEDFFLSYLTTVRQPTELVVDVSFPRRFRSWGFSEVQRRTGDFAIVAAAVAIWNRQEMCGSHSQESLRNPFDRSLLKRSSMQVLATRSRQRGQARLQPRRRNRSAIFTVRRTIGVASSHQPCATLSATR